MTSRGRVLLIVLLVALGACEFSWLWYRAVMHARESIQAQIALDANSRATTNLPPGKGHLFTAAELHGFLEAARKAEAIADPLQRCLTYPDPPGSHWSPAAIRAYCQYHLQPTISLAEADTLIRSGHAADLDRRLAQDLQAQLTRPESRGLIDHTYVNDFENGSFDVRQTLDAWKRASPSSAFAYAASGAAYVTMAAKARGGAYISDTPQSNIDAMDRLLQQADADLQHAVALNPKVTPAYVAMIDAGKMSLGRSYLLKAAARGLAAAPDNYAIYATLSEAMQPKWGGSLGAMSRLAARAQLQVQKNPLLVIQRSLEPAYQYDVCNCMSSANWAAFPLVFDNLSSATLLFDAGYAANSGGHADLAAIYLSEGLRFRPDDTNARMRRNYALSRDGASSWALDDANRWIGAWPQSPWGYSMRGYAYKSLRDDVHAAPDLEKAAALDPGNIWPLAELGDMYASAAPAPGAWDKAWDVANRLVQNHPADIDGWMLRARIQTYQPRPGLDDTAQHVFANFGSDPDQRGPIAQMQMMVEQTHRVKTGAGSFGHPRTAGARYPATAASSRPPRSG